MNRTDFTVDRTAFVQAVWAVRRSSHRYPKHTTSAVRTEHRSRPVCRYGVMRRHLSPTCLGSDRTETAFIGLSRAVIDVVLIESAVDVVIANRSRGAFSRS
ncbi:unnamed protein product, partial [Iphiclides podalirius]